MNRLRLSIQYLGLTSKLIIMLVFWITCSFGYWSWQSYQEEISKFEQQLKETEVRNYELFKTLIEKDPEQLISLAETLLSDIPSHVSNDDKLATHASQLKKRWEHYTFSWALTSASIFDNDKNLIIHLGDNAFLQSKHTEWMRALEDTSMQPVSHLHCEQQCLYHIGIPISGSGKQRKVGALFITASFADTLINLQKQTHTDIAIINRQANDQHGLSLQAQPIEPINVHNKDFMSDLYGWQANVISVPNREKNLPLLYKISQNYSLSDIDHISGLTIENNHHHHHIHIINIDTANKNNIYLTLISDITEDVNAINKSLKDNIFYLFVSSALFFFTLIIFLWKPVRRIHRQAHIMALLGQGKYDSVRDQLPDRISSYLNDELDMLEISTLSLSHQLESMQHQLQQRAEAMEKLAMYDSLTGLPNRHHFLKILSQAVKTPNTNEEKVILFYFDLDKFKRVNDSLGHHVGDELLIHVSQRLNKILRANEFLARIGGDEFVLVLTTSTTLEAAIDNTTQRLLESFQSPIELAHIELIITTSIGIAYTKPNKISPLDLVKNADLAMYRAKELGRNQHCIFDEYMKAEANQSLKLESELRSAFDNDQFELYFQAKVNLHTGAITGFEALTRWQHPKKGILPPIVFINALEASGKISELDDWVLIEACSTLERWWKSGIQANIAINISSYQFNDSSFIQKILQVIQSFELGHNKLEIEITESLLMENLESATSTIKDLSKIGIRVSLDDFGQGYSSLSYLHKLPINTIKLDKEFIENIDTDINNQAIYQAVRLLAEQMGLELIAEGIETIDQLKYLQSERCIYGQGYYFSKPVCEGDALALLDQPHLTNYIAKQA